MPHSRSFARRPGRPLAAGIAFLTVLVCVHGTAQADLFGALKGLLGGGSEKTAAALGDAEIGGGLREALRVATGRVVEQVGAVDGFNADPAIHIPLPGALASVQSALARVGLSGMTDDLETKLNRAAEAAAPEAKEVFWQAITEMTLDDVQAIYNGPENAATEYFREKMTPNLVERMSPIVQDSLSQVGAVQSFDSVMSRYKAVPFVPDVKADLTEHVVTRALDGTFHYVAKEEAAIRSDPAARSTEILRKVFGRD